MDSRPISQQGIGLNPPSTPGLNPNYHDKRYYVRSVQNHMQSLTNEIIRLKKQLSESKFEAANYEECKRQAEENAKQLSEHEETLMVYNTAIETVMFKGSKNNIDTEAERIRRSKLELIHQLELMYSEKLKLDEKLAIVREELETEKQLFNEKISTLPENLQAKYQSLKQSKDKLKREEEIFVEKIKNLKKNIDNYEQQIFRNERKSVYYNLSSKLKDIQRRHKKLEDENKVERSPSQEREYLLEQVKQDRADIEMLKMQCDEQRSELEKQKDRLSELEDELSEKNSARLNKYRELLKRQETMSTFLEAFPHIFKEEFQKVKDNSHIIVNSLEYISRNSIDNNLTQDVENDPNYIFTSNLTKDELEKEYKKVQMQYNMLNSVYERHKKEMGEIKNNNEEFIEDLETYKDIDQAKQNFEQQQISLEMRVATLKSTLTSTRLAVTEAAKRNNELENQLDSNEKYRIVTNLEKALQKLEEENKNLEEIMNNSPGLKDFQKFKSKSLEEVAIIFKELMLKHDGKK